MIWHNLSHIFLNKGQLVTEWTNTRLKISILIRCLHPRRNLLFPVKPFSFHIQFCLIGIYFQTVVLRPDVQLLWPPWISTVTPLAMVAVTEFEIDHIWKTTWSDKYRKASCNLETILKCQMKARLLKNGILLIFNKKKYHGNPQIVDKEND